MGFNLDNYETVKQRKARFYTDFPNGICITNLLEHSDNHCLIKATIYKNEDLYMKGVCLATGHAMEFKGQGGMANKHAWVENCEESAVGRALDNANYNSGSCSREEMIKVKVAEEAQRKEESKELEEMDPRDDDQKLFDHNHVFALVPKYRNRTLVDLDKDDVIKYLKYFKQSKKGYKDEEHEKEIKLLVDYAQHPNKYKDMLDMVVDTKMTNEEFHNGVDVKKLEAEDKKPKQMKDVSFTIGD